MPNMAFVELTHERVAVDVGEVRNDGLLVPFGGDLVGLD